MINEKKKKPVTEVWVLSSSPDGQTCSDRVFAEMGDRETKMVGDEIASACGDAFTYVIDSYVKALVRKELENGETEIHIDPEDNEFTEFRLIKAGIDTGIEVFTFDECEKPDKEHIKEVYAGSTIYATEGWSGDIKCLYSTNWQSGSTPLIIE